MITPATNFALLLSVIGLLVFMLWRSRKWSTPMVLVALDQLRTQMGGLMKEVHAARLEAASATAQVSHYGDRLRHLEHRTAQLSENMDRFPCAECPAVKAGDVLPGVRNHRKKERDDA